MQIICHGLKEEDFPVEFTDHKIFIGRDESNSIPVSAEGISRFHAILIEEGDGLFLQDNDSLNGTFLNYKQVRGRQKLVNGDIVQIGYRLIRVDFKPEQDAVVLDFVPPEETEMVSQVSAAVPPDSGEPERTMVASDDIERTMIASETMLSRSSMPDKTLLPGGTEIGKYVIIKRLGKGGMGEVYLAKHKTLGICRALKVLSKDAEGGDSRFLERFLREAKLASEIRHPNVVGVMDVETGEDCGFPYIVMEYVDGGSLRNSLTATKRLSEEQAVVIVEAVASALQAAEEHNIVHRDIKPDNIMFTRRGEVKLADLGIAKVDGKDNDFTKTNMMIGTPAYLPPEQAQNAKAVDARADIYSLGATFYEMLTGQQPYPGENSIEVLHKLFLTPVPDPRKINPEVSAASAAIVMKMMAKDPKDRFQNATELLAMMEKTFPPHTASEAADLIQKAVAGVSQSNASFSSNISSSRLSLWWLKLPNKKFVLPVAGLVFAICVLCILFPFLGKKPSVRSFTGGDVPGSSPVEAETETGTEPESGAEAKNSPIVTEKNPVQEKTHVLRIRTTPDADIRVIFPDGRMTLYSADPKGTATIPDLNAGRYRIRISRTDYLDLTREIKVEKDMTLNLQLETALLTGNRNHDALAERRNNSTTGINRPSSSSASSFESSANSDLLLVTTEKDVVDPNDGVNSLREALENARKHGLNASISFAKDCRIKLSSSLVISQDTEIDGGGNIITIIGPEKEPMFSVSRSRLTLKRMTLNSDYSGDDAGILSVRYPSNSSSMERTARMGWFWDGQGGIPSDLVELVSVRDGGNAKCLWNLSGVGMLLDGACYLHRLSASKGGVVKIMTDSTLVDSSLSGGYTGREDGDFMVFGTLGNVTVSNYGDIYLFRNGKIENLTVKKNGFVENRGGSISGMKVEYGGVYGYEPGSFLYGTISVGGVTKAQKIVAPTVNKRTDIVFDLTERTEKSGFSFFYTTDLYSFNIQNDKYPHSLLDNMELFYGANSYTVQVREDQPRGTYILAGNATDFNDPVSLKIDDTFYPEVLSIGRRFTLSNKVYVLSIRNQGEVVTTGGNTLILRIYQQ